VFIDRISSSNILNQMLKREKSSRTMMRHPIVRIRKRAISSLFFSGRLLEVVLIVDTPTSRTWKHSRRNEPFGTLEILAWEGE